MRKGQNCFLVRNKNFYDPKIKIFKINAKIKKKKNNSNKNRKYNCCGPAAFKSQRVGYPPNQK